MAQSSIKSHIVSGQPKKIALDAHINTYISVVSDLGYSPSTLKTQFNLLKSLMRWIKENHVDTSSIDEDIINRFLIESGRKGAVRRGDTKTLHRFLDHLRREGVIPHLKPIFNDSPLTQLKNRYQNFLLKERGLSPVTWSRYWPYIQKFLLERFGNKPMQFGELCPQDIDRFVLRHAHKRTPKVAQLMVSAMRSFFRFLFRHGETKLDFSTAVPTVAAWRLSEIPKYIKAEEVESLLESCDRTTTVGRRNYAILLLIARLGLRAGEIVALELDDMLCF